MNAKVENKENVSNDTIHNVMPSFLTNGLDQIICENRGELLYVLEYAKHLGKNVSDYMFEVNKFPYHLFIADDIVSWTDSTDRVGKKWKFIDFIKYVNWA